VHPCLLTQYDFIRTALFIITAGAMPQSKGRNNARIKAALKKREYLSLNAVPLQGIAYFY
jgi:hypothetical protein